ncbi:MAG: signal peptide peptidase SppA [Candidatus Aminicenantes bacterium]|nr:signal peptide peptidase SppA [Candidatus Aminicenantes bacterium]
MKNKILLSIMLVVWFGMTGCAPHIHIDFMGKEDIREVQLIKSKVKEKILVIDLNGTITTQQNPGLLNRGGDLLSNIYYRLQTASRDPLVKGVILRIDSPGGDGTTSDIILHEILQFRKKTNIPVVALMMGVAASGGYYVACGCDTIIAHPTTITGSIGVIAVLPGLKGMLDKIGVEINIIKSGKMKDVGSPFKDLTQEGRTYIQDMVDQMYRKFLQVVHHNRKAFLSMAEIENLADGRVYHAQQALDLKLIDEIGYFDAALKRTLSLAKIPAANVVAYTYHPKRKTNIYANVNQQGNPLTVEIDALKHLLPTLKTGFYYLWLPLSNN